MRAATSLKVVVRTLLSSARLSPAGRAFDPSAQSNPLECDRILRPNTLALHGARSFGYESTELLLREPAARSRVLTNSQRE